MILEGTPIRRGNCVVTWKSIGIFDSGVGGLTVLREIMHALPQEDTLYFGDTARVPYGTKSPETVIRYSGEIASFLIRRDIKLLVVACNTASAVALPTLKRQLSCRHHPQQRLYQGDQTPESGGRSSDPRLSAVCTAGRGGLD